MENTIYSKFKEEKSHKTTGALQKGKRGRRKLMHGYSIKLDLSSTFCFSN
jgi:hypothetical protein